MQRDRAYWVLAMGALIWLLLVASAPLLAEFRLDETAAIVGSAFGRVCHQRPERSFALLGRPLPVCARCFGLYLGLPAGLLILPFVPRVAVGLGRRPRLLGLFVLPMFLDVLFAGDHRLIRSITGLLASFPVSYFLWRGLSELRSSPFLRSIR
jgi:uncharacterized membrane protein